jgi:ABC-2 type transport system ATP-binding protein
MIEVSDLHKKFKDVKALDGVSFSVNEGELLGVIGPDGAGKTTLFRLIISLMLPDSGSIRLWGLDPVKDYKKVRQIIGYMPGRFSLYEDLSIQENLQFFATVFGTTIEENYHLIEDIYKQIEPFKDRPAGKLSGGMKQKLALSCALIHRPRLLVLDEPTTGVDAVSRQEFWEMLKKLQKEGITIIVSTPYMDEASLCDRVALLDSGHILDSGTPDSIAKGFGRPLFGVKNGDMYQLLQLCRSFSGIDTVYPFGEWLHITFKEDGLNGEVLQKYLVEKGIIDPVVEPIEPQIEDCFLGKVGEG